MLLACLADRRLQLTDTPFAFVFCLRHEQQQSKMPCRGCDFASVWCQAKVLLADHCVCAVGLAPVVEDSLLVQLHVPLSSSSIGQVHSASQEVHSESKVSYCWSLVTTIRQ